MSARKPPSQYGSVRMTDFETFWKAYPKKKSKLQALRTWEKLAKIRPPIEELLAAIARARKSDSWAKAGGQYIPYPSTWLNDGGWMDEEEVDMKDIVNDKPWHESWPGIQAKGAELGVIESKFSSPQDFRAAVIKAAKEGLKVA
jgi:hypothetical protein